MYDISIIVTVYNIKEELVRCSLNSVSIQTYRNFECIVVDDGSSNGSAFICDEFAEKDSRFKVIHLDHKGVSCARNAGLSAIAGSYIVFMDGDDFFPSEDCIFKLVSFLKKTFCDILFFKHIILEEHGFLNHVPTAYETIDIPDINDVIYKVISEQDTTGSYMYGAPWGKAYNANFLLSNHLKFPPGIKKSQDRIFMTQVLLANPRLSCVDYYGYVYIKNDDSVSRKYNPDIFNILRASSNVMEKTIESVPDSYLRSSMEDAFCYFKYKCMINYNNLYFFSKDHKKSIKDYCLFKQVCIDNYKYYSKCFEFNGLSKKRRIQLFFLKRKLYGLAYLIRMILND